MEQIIPVFIIGAARNGTTSLTNLISSFPEFAQIEHELHRGNHEAKLYNCFQYYGDISKPDSYLDFIYHFSSGDYFQLANGDFQYHLENPKSNFFEFYFDMMNHHCITHGKKFWLAKLDTSFFTDKRAFDLFIKTLNESYKEVKFIRIQRDFEQALLSAVYMPGKKYSNSKTGFRKIYRLLNYTQQWFKTYLLQQEHLKNSKILHIDFNNLVNDKVKIKNTIKGFLGIYTEVITIKEKNYSINTSFSKNEKFKLNKFDLWISNAYLNILKKLPNLPSLIQYFYFSILKSKPTSPISRRILKNLYFKKQLRNELHKLGSFGLVDKLDKELANDKFS